MSQYRSYLWNIAVIALAVVGVVLCFSYIVTEPWRIIPDIGGDGVKNDLTYLYHSAYGKGYWFTGMNYPYGEHIVFTDGIPLLSVLFASIGNVRFETALTVLWWLFGLSYVLSVWYLFRVLAVYIGRSWFSVLAALLITFLTPQIICIRGHYALAFTCIIPMLFYWTVAYHRSQRWYYVLYMALVGVISALLHPYYAGMLLVWAGVYAVVYWLLVRSATLRTRVIHVSGPLLAAAFAAAVIMVILKVTDPATDRPGTPYNPTDSYTHLSQIVSSIFSPFWSMAVERHWVPKASDGGEGFTYPGLMPLMIMGLAFAGLVYSWLFRQRKLPEWGSGLGLWLLLAVIVLLFSMGIPFIWNMQWLVNYLPVFRQFRALGRFAWIFYYVFTALAAIISYRWFLAAIKHGYKKYAITLMAIFIAVWSVEAWGYMSFGRHRAEDAAYNYDFLFQTKEKNWTAFLAEQDMNSQSFQAILLLKYFHIGTEKIWVGDPGWIMTLGSRAALQLKLPLLNVMMSRSSWGQAFQQVRLMGGPFTDKTVLNSLESDKPFLLLKFREDSLMPDEEYLLSASDFIGDFSDCKVYACYPARIQATDAARRGSVKTLLPLAENGDAMVGDGSYGMLHFDDGPLPGISGKAIPCISGSDSTFATFAVKPDTSRRLYEFSCWFLLGTEDYRSPEVRLDMLNEQGDVMIQEVAPCKESVDNKGMWLRCSRYFYIPAGCTGVRCVVLNAMAPAYKAMDEVVLRPASSLVIKAKSGIDTMVNGHLFIHGRNGY